MPRWKNEGGYEQNKQRAILMSTEVHQESAPFLGNGSVRKVTQSRFCGSLHTHMFFARVAQMLGNIHSPSEKRDLIFIASQMGEDGRESRGTKVIA